MTTGEPRWYRLPIYTQPIAGILLPVLLACASSGVAHRGPAPVPSPPTGRIFVTSYAENAVFAYRPGASGNVTPDFRIGQVLASPTGVAIDRRGRLYVTNTPLATISIFGGAAKGDTPPIETIGGGNTQLELPEGIAIGPRARIYVTNAGIAPDFAGSIMIFAPDAEGNVAPTATITGPKTGLHECSAIALDSTGRIYVVNGGGKFPASINVYAARGNGDIAPIASIAGPKTRLSSPTGVALDSKGRIYVTNPAKDPSLSAVEVYPAGSDGDVAPVTEISGSQTELGDPQGVALDSHDNIFVTNDAVIPSGREISRFPYDSVNVYPAGSNGDVAPAIFIRGTKTGLNSPEGIALGAYSHVYVANSGTYNMYPGTVTVYPPARSGNLTPLTTITGGLDTGIVRPMAIALDARGNIYVANLDASVTVYAAGTDRNVRPVATIKGPHTQLCPNSIAIDPGGNIYVANKFRGALGDRVRSNESVSITTYPARSNGDVIPSDLISGTRTGLRDPPSIAVDSARDIYVANSGGDLRDERGRWVLREVRGSVTVYRAGRSGNVAPIATIAGAHSGIDFSKSLGGDLGIALDSRGRIYVANSGGGSLHHGSVTVYPPLAKLSEQPGYPDVKPITTIAGVSAMLAHPQAIALDSLGRIYVLSEDIDAKPQIDRITVYPALGDYAGNLDERPTAVIEGSHTELDSLPSGLAVLGPAGNPTMNFPPPAKQSGRRDFGTKFAAHGFGGGAKEVREASPFAAARPENPDRRISADRR